MILKQDIKTGYWTKFDGLFSLTNVHNPKLCEGRGCAIHNHPSDHGMVYDPLNWREDRGFLERICVHNFGHPDPDAALYLETIGQGAENVHGCCGYGCCTL